MIALALAVLSPFASAGLPTTGAWLPGAADPGDNHGGVSVTGAGAVVYAGAPGAIGGGSANAWGAFGPNGAFAVQGSFATLTRAADGVTGLYALGGVRYEVLNEKRFALAPWFGALAEVEGDLLPGEVYLALGIAGEATLGKARLDFSVPLVIVPTDDPDYFFDADGGINEGIAAALVTADLGVTVALGERDELRFGKVLFVPGVQWRHDFGRLYLEAGASVWLLVNEAHLGVGATF